jgi:hypothetical protein
VEGRTPKAAIERVEQTINFVVKALKGTLPLFGGHAWGGLCLDFDREFGSGFGHVDPPTEQKYQIKIDLNRRAPLTQINYGAPTSRGWRRT